jgi:hypothetical protein
MKPLRALATLALVSILISLLGCQKESESVVSIALHTTNANILYLATTTIYAGCDGRRGVRAD